jgi:4-amino-4-deoxy-L-arabinose transferase-like glycosyltransferase
MATGAVFVLARRLGTSRTVAAWSSILFAFTPALALNATSSKNDIAVAALYLYIAALWITPLHRRLVGRRWLLTLVAILLGTGMKPTLLFMLPGLLWLAATGARKADFTCLQRFRPAPWTGTLVVLALLLAGYWYARNWVQFNNPFHPASFRVAGHLIAGSGAASSQQGAFTLDSLKADLQTLGKQKIYDGGLPYNPDLGGMTGWGWFVFVCGGGTLVWGLLVNQRLRWLALSFLTSFLLLFGWVSPDPWNMRFAQWFPALAALGFAVTVQHQALLSFVRFALILLATWTTALNGLGILGNGYTKARRWLDFINMPVSRRAPDDQDGIIPQRALEKHIILGPGEAITIMGLGDDALYPLYGPDFSRRLIYPKKRERSKGFSVFMRQNKSKFLYFPDYIPAGPSRDRLNQEIQAQKMKKMGREFYRLVAEKEVL